MSPRKHDVPDELLSRLLANYQTDAVVDEVKTWQSRPLDPVYPIVYLDCFAVAQSQC